MDGEQEETQGQAGGQAGQAQEGAAQGGKDVPSGKDDWQAQVAQRDARIAELEAQVEQAAKTAEAAQELKGQIEALKAAAQSDREEFELRLARALLADHGGDVAALAKAEPWLFGNGAGDGAAPVGTTGLPGAGAASDEAALLSRWRQIAGLEDDNEAGGPDAAQGWGW